jgi:hypothetical protein
MAAPVRSWAAVLPVIVGGDPLGTGTDARPRRFRSLWGVLEAHAVRVSLRPCVELAQNCPRWPNFALYGVFALWWYENAPEEEKPAERKNKPLRRRKNRREHEKSPERIARG